MSTLDTSSNGSLDAGAIVALGLLGAGLAVGAGTVLRNPESRAACVRFMRELGLPQMGREVAAGILLKLGASLSGHDAIVLTNVPTRSDSSRPNSESPSV